MNYKPRKSRKKNNDGKSPLSNLNFPAVSFNQSEKPIKKIRKRSAKNIKQKVNKLSPISVKQEIELTRKSPIRKSPSPMDIKKLTPKTQKKRLDLLKRLNIMSCADIKLYLETTQMNEEEKIVFIKQNMVDNKSLRNYISKQHFNIKDLNFMSDAGSSILNTLGNETKKIYESFMGSDELDENDEDCKYLQNILKQYENQKSGGYLSKALTLTKDVLSTTGKVLYETGKFVGSKAYDVFNYLATRGFQLWTWISSNPKSAYFALVMLKSLKTQLCRFCGESLGLFGSWSGMRDRLITVIKHFYPDADLNPNTSLSDLKSMVKDVSKPFVTEIISKSVVSIFNTVWDNKSTLFSGAITSAFSLIPGVGPILGSGFSAIFDTVLSNTKDSINLMQEQMVYQTHVSNAFSMLFEIVNPFECIDNMLKEVYESASIVS
jgi:hypothetical protein